LQFRTHPKWPSLGAVALALALGAGCSQQPTADSNHLSTAALEKNLSTDDLAAVKKFAPPESPAYRSLLKFKNMEKDGNTKVTLPAKKAMPPKRG
jgi:outer membrane murein-binding lipoprotein Lpp